MAAALIAAIALGVCCRSSVFFDTAVAAVAITAASGPEQPIRLYETEHLLHAGCFELHKLQGACRAQHSCDVSCVGASNLRT